MASIRPSALIGDIKGTIGAVSFARSGSSLVVRRARSAGSVATSAALEARARLPRARILWANLTDTERQQWDQYALMHTRTDRLGQMRTLSGWQWFSWWIPYAEAGAVESIAPDYGVLEHTVKSQSVQMATADFSAGGDWNFETEIDIYGTYTQMIRVRIGPCGPHEALWPRRWFDCGWLAVTAQTFNVRSMVEARGVQLQEGQWFRYRLQQRMLGTPNYWPSDVWEYRGQVAA